MNLVLSTPSRLRPSGGVAGADLRIVSATSSTLTGSHGVCVPVVTLQTASGGLWRCAALLPAQPLPDDCGELLGHPLPRLIDTLSLVAIPLPSPLLSQTRILFHS